MNVNIYTDKKTNPAKIRVKINHKREFQQSIGTNYSIDPKYWDLEKQRPDRSYKYYKDLKRKIDDIEDAIFDLTQEFIFSKDMSYDDFKIKAKDIVKSDNYKSHGSTTTKPKFILDAIDEYIEYLASKSTNTRSRGTVGNITTLKSHLQDFEKERGSRIKYNEVGKLFFQEFYTHLSQKENKNKKGQGLTLNTVANNLRKFKMFMSWSYDHEYLDNLNFRKYKVRSEKVDKVSLSLDEIDQIKNYTPKDIKEEEVIDLFLFLVSSGQRYSAAEILEWEHIDLIEKHVHFRDPKTSKLYDFYLQPLAYEILKKYHEAKSPDPIPKMECAILNRNIKKILSKIGLDKTIVLNKTVRGTKQDFSYKKYELISSHTGRRSLATIMHYKGTPAKDIMRFTNHSSIKQLHEYIQKDDDKDHLDRIGDIFC